jgi:hypothetical protein
VANDHLQILREAIIAVLDTHADIVAITGRGTENIVAWGSLGSLDDATRALGVIAYHVIVGSEVAADQNAEAHLVQFAAVAAEESVANELIGVVTRVLDGPAFLALVPPLDARAENRIRRPAPFDPEEDLARSDIDITLHVHF